MATSTASPSNARRTAILLVAVAFIAGALIGFAAGRIYLIHHGGPLRDRGAEFVRDRMLKHLDRELSLTPEQHAKVAQIMDRHHQRMDEIVAGVRPQIRQEIDAASREIDAVLTPEQKQKFVPLRMRMENRLPHRR